MSNPESGAGSPADASRDDIMSALFADLIFQNTNMALMFLGHSPHPQTGEKTTDLEAARMFIDQLEMLAAKTKGNLSKDEERLLQQNLTHLRLSFVDAVEHSSAPAPEIPAAGTTPPPDPAAPAPDPGAASDESAKRLSRKH